MRKTSTAAIALACGLAVASPLAASELVIESWRNDDITIWQQVIIPAFNASHPEITVRFQPTAPAEYHAALNAELDGGTAGDLLTCRPFDASLQLFNRGHLVELTGLEELQNFPTTATAAWSTDDGSRTFCMPMASVSHGFMYNVDAFNELGLAVPTTEDAFFTMSAFKPPVRNAGDPCDIADHVDIGMGINAASPNREAAMTFIRWVGSAQFAELYANALPGFFSLSNHPIMLEDPVAQAFVSWRDECSSSIRIAQQILSRGTPNSWNDMWVMSANVSNGVMTPEAAAERLPTGLASWYEPQNN